MLTGVETSWLCFLVEYLAFELGQAFPGHLSHPELAAASRIPAVGTAGRCSQLEAPPWSSCCSSRLCRTMGNPPGLWTVSRGTCWLLKLPSPAAGSGSGEPWPAAPGERGHCQGRTRAGCCPHATQRVHQGFSRTEHCRFYSKSKEPRALHSRLVLMIKGKLHPFCSAWMKF